MTQPKKVDFYQLSRPVQDRFAAATRRSAPPAPLLYASAPRTTAWFYLGGSLALAVVAAVVLRLGWGDPSSPLAMHGPKMLAVDVLLFAGAAYGVTHALGILRALDSLPWRPGRYLFPSCVVDARGPVLEVWSIGDAEGVERVSGAQPGLALRMGDGSRVVVPASSTEQADRADAALGNLRNELARALAEDDSRALAELDPLHDRAMSSPIGPTEAMKRVVVVSKRFDWAIAVAAGVLLGLGLGSTRNATSDEAMYATVVGKATQADYELYLAQGVRHADEVREILLPRLQLRDAEMTGTVDAVQAFADAHPDSKIDADIDASLRRSMLAALEHAKKAGTVAAIDELAKKYPNHKVDPEIKAARHALFVQALDSWKKTSKPDPATSAFMERLLAWTEGQGSGCEMHFRFRPSKSLEDADKSIRRSGHYPAQDALPSNYLTIDAMRPLEQQVADALAQGFATEFPPDVLALHPGPPLDPDAPGPTNAPALTVDYTFEWARDNTLSTKPLTVFAGFIFTYDAAFTIPQGAPWKTSTRAPRVAEVWKVKAGDMSREDYEKKIYSQMLDGAFDQLEKKLTAVLL